MNHSEEMLQCCSGVGIFDQSIYAQHEPNESPLAGIFGVWITDPDGSNGRWMSDRDNNCDVWMTDFLSATYAASERRFVFRGVNYTVKQITQNETQ